jgi:uncharacterized protein YhhL (DUF1145 family)
MPFVIFVPKIELSIQNHGFVIMICYIIIGSFDPFASNWEVLILSSQLVLLLMHGMVHAVLFAGLPPETLSVALLIVVFHSS